MCGRTARTDRCGGGRKPAPVGLTQPRGVGRLPPTLPMHTRKRRRAHFERPFADSGDCHSTDVLVQPITASIQRARVPPWEFSDCPGSHIRRARGATLGRESPEVQVPGGSTLLGSCRLVQGREQSLGPQRQANRCSVVTVSHQEPPSGGAHGQLWECGSAEPVRTGRRPVSAGKNRTYAPAGLLGVEAVAPRKGSMSQSGEGLEPSQDPTAWQRLGV